MADHNKNYFQRRTKDKGPRSNNRIYSPEVQVISSAGENLGILNLPNLYKLMDKLIEKKGRTA